MLIKQELISKIKDYFNLNIYETKVWLALIGKGVASAGEISVISGVPRSRTYDVLEGLEKKGFAIVKIGKPVKYIGVRPRMVLEKIKNNLRKESQEQIEELLNVKKTIEFMKLEEIYKKGLSPAKKENLSLSLKGKLAISSQINESLGNAKKEIMICFSAEEIKAKFKLFYNTFKKLKKEGIKIKIALYGEKELIKELSKNLNLRIYSINISSKFFIIDREQILFYLFDNKKEEETAIWLNSSFFSNTFAILFEKSLSK
jgi:HTH-type transcriptional regulator, sugar sensing transcriptional regulator